MSLQYNIKKPYKLQNILDTLVFVRNSCAHSGVIYDLHLDEGVVEMPSYKFNNDYSHSLDAAIKALLYVMEYISLDRKNDLQVKINLLFAEFKEDVTIKAIIESKLGY